MNKLSNILKRLKKIPAQITVGAGLILIGLAIVGLVWFNNDRPERSATKPQPVAKVLKNTAPVQNSQPDFSGVPVHISIPSVAIDLQVIPGYYNKSDGSWTLTPTNAQWGSMTAEPNNKEGDTFIYGHALMNVFGRLPGVKPGAQAVITTGNNHTFTYAFTNSTVTTPEDTRLFTYQGKPILILQTCTGAWYQYRQLFVFDLTKVS